MHWVICKIKKPQDRLEAFSLSYGVFNYFLGTGKPRSRIKASIDASLPRNLR